jgi:hypothetical protein
MTKVALEKMGAGKRRIATICNFFNKTQPPEAHFKPS